MSVLPKLLKGPLKCPICNKKMKKARIKNLKAYKCPKCDRIIKIGNKDEN